MLDNIDVLCHSSIRLNLEKIIYIDPFRVKKKFNDADLIFITHNHYDHYSEEDIDNVKKQDTVFIVPETLKTRMLEKGYNKDNIVTVKPNKNYIVQGIKVETIPAYNINKEFHPKSNEWVGYVIEVNDIRYYIAGDTDVTEESKVVKCDIAFIPVGGKYTTNYQEAAYLVNEIKPKIAIPTHYGSVVGEKQDAISFIKLLLPSIKGKILFE